MAKKHKGGIPYHDYLVESLIGDEESQMLLIKTSFEENWDMPEAILSAIRVVAEARGFKNFAESADLNRENLYRVLSKKGNPRLDTFFKILDALGLKLTVELKSKIS